MSGSWITKRPPGRKNAHHFARCLLLIAQVMKGVDHNDSIKGRIWQRAAFPTRPVPDRAPSRSPLEQALLKHSSRRIKDAHLRHATAKVLGNPPCSASDVQQTMARLRSHKRDQLIEVS